MKRICSILLAAVLSCSLLGCNTFPLHTVAASFVGTTRTGSEESLEHAHTDLSFSELSDDDAQLDLELARIRELLFRIESGELRGAEAQRQLDRRIDAFHALRTAASIAHVRYCEDLSDTGAKAKDEHFSNGVEALACLLIDAQLALSADPALSDVYDAQTVSKLKEADAMHDPAAQRLSERERELIGAYDALESMTISYAGRDWTREQILSDVSLSYDRFSELYRAYRHAYNEAAGTIYLELIETRNETARTLGFESYAEYGYAAYARDYSTEEACELAETVRREIVPVFRELEPAFFEAGMRLGCGTFYEEPTLQRVQTAVEHLMPELMRPWNYLFQHGMYASNASENRMPGSFTAYFESYGAPFLFTSWDNSHEMTATILHEFGHCAGYYLNGVQRMQSSDPLDLAEIDSQGLELLAISQYDILYGALSDAAKIYQLAMALYAVITGCMEDAFQQYAYHTEGVTLEALNAEYERLADAFGLRDMGLSGESWTEISHTFRAPMYYISYATSMLGALQIYVRSEDDRTGAIEAYRSILMRPVDATFRDTLRQTGLMDPFDPDTVAALAARIRTLCCN